MVLERTALNLNCKNDMRAGRQNEDFFSGFEGCHLFFTTWARDFDTEVAN